MKLKPSWVQMAGITVNRLPDWINDVVRKHREDRGANKYAEVNNQSTLSVRRGGSLYQPAGGASCVLLQVESDRETILLLGILF